MLHSTSQQIWKTQQWPQDWKRSVYITIPKKGSVKECSNYCTIVLISHANKVMLKILLSNSKSFSTWTENFQMYNLGYKEAEESTIKLPTFVGLWRKQRSSRKTSASLTTLKPLTAYQSQKPVENFQRLEDHTTLSVSWETCTQVKKQRFEPDLEKPTGSKLGEECDKTLYCHPAYLTYMQSTSCKILGWMNHKLESSFPGEISTASDMQMVSL